MLVLSMSEAFCLYVILFPWPVTCCATDEDGYIHVVFM